MTQAQVAEAANIGTSFYGQIERGANTPSLKTLAAVASALKANPSDPARISKEDRGKRSRPEITSPSGQNVHKGLQRNNSGNWEAQI